MIQTIKKAWAIPELRKKIVFTALILLIFRIGNAIPVPYVDTKLLGDYLSQMSTTVLGLYDVMSGGAFASATVFALGVQPYINSSIIIQLLTIAIPPLERLAREGGEEGKKKIQSITRYATVAIAILQGLGYYALMKNANILTNTGVWAALVIIISFIAGSSFVMWMGEQVTEFTEQGRRVNSAGGPNYAPKLFAENPGAEGCTKRGLGSAMEALLAAGKLIVEQEGPPSRRVSYLAEATR